MAHFDIEYLYDDGHVERHFAVEADSVTIAIDTAPPAHPGEGIEEVRVKQVYPDRVPA